MIRFSALLVAVATGLLIAGVIVSRLALVYVAIAISAVALVMLGIGAFLKQDELFGKPQAEDVPQAERAMPVAAAAAPASAAWGADSFPAASAWPATPSSAASSPATASPGTGRPAPASSGSGWTGSGWGEETSKARESRSGLPEAGRFETNPAAFAPFTATVRPAEPARSAWPPAPDVAPKPAPAKGDETVAVPSLSQPAVADDAPEDAGEEATTEVAAATAPATDGLKTDEIGEIGEPDKSASAEPAADAEPAAAEPEPAADAEPAAEPESAAAPESPVSDHAPAVYTETVAAPAVPIGDDGEASKPAPEPDPAREVTVVPGVPRYHNARCILIRFMGEDALEKMTLADAREAGCTACRACLPDQETD